LVNNTIIGNQETNGGNGGGVMIDVLAAPLVSGNLIQNNSANANGGGLSVNSSAQLVNNVIIGNSASSGGGIYSSLNQAQPSFVNNTVAGNSASQGAQLFIDGFDANAEIANNLLIDFTGTGAVFCGSSSGQIPAFDHDNVFSITPDGRRVPAYGGACPDVTGISGNLSADPEFVDNLSGNYHLFSGSPALDSGNNSAPNLPAADLEGNPRIAASNTATCVGVVDMGAYELVAPSTGAGFLSLQSLDFGTASIGAGAGFPQTVTFFASQGCVQAAVQIHGSDFQQASDCTALQAGNSCTIQVTFDPTAPGLRTGVLAVNLGPGATSVTAGLTGDGQNSGQVSPANLDFGPLFVGGSGFTQSVTVFSNSGRLQVANVSITGDYSQSNFCAQTFGNGCDIEVAFAPKTAGLRTGVLTVTSNVGVFTVPLSGTGLAPVASIAPAALVFPSQIVNTSSPAQAVTLTNVGPVGLLINGFNINSFEYTAQPVTCFGTISPGASCTYSVSFSPFATGDRSGTLEVDTNGGNVTVALDGSGTPPIAGLSPQFLTFPAGSIGSSSAAQTVTVTNISGGPLQITS
ncbi:MAG: choice-of-anchor D domain-containing protein, partial [Candidatus Angelobacter sp.]